MLSKDVYKVVQVTDTHLFSSPDRSLYGINSQRSLAAILAHAARHHAPIDGLLATGDLVHDGSPEGYRRLNDALAALNVPSLCLPGNHDDPRVMDLVFGGPLVTCRKTATLGAWKIVLLNTHVPGSDGGRLAPDELHFLDQELARDSTLHTAVALHHPPVAIGSPWMDAIGLTNATEFFDVLARHSQVRIVLFGHIHQEFEQQHNGIRLLAAPSTSAQFKPRTLTHVNDTVPPGYRWLALHADGSFDTGVERVALAAPDNPGGNREG